MHIESLREQSSVSLLAQRSAVGLFTVLALLVTAGAVIRNYTKYDTLSLPLPQKEQAVVIPDTPDGEEEESALIQAIRCWNVSDYESAEPLLKQALTDAESETEKLRYPGAAAVNLRLGMLSYECGRYTEAKKYLETAKNGFQSTLGDGAPEVLLTDGQRALCEIITGNEKKGWELLQTLEPVAESAEKPADRMDACNLLARGCVLTEQTADAVKWYEKLIKTAEDSCGEQNYLKDYQAEYAEMLLADGQTEHAAELCRSVISARNSELSAHRRTEFNLLLARASADGAAAEEALSAADAAYREESHTNLEDAEYALEIVKIRRAAGDFDAARKAAEDAVSAAAGTEAEAACTEQLGIVYEKADQLDKALSYYEKALTLSRDRKDDLQTASCLTGICRVTRLQEDYVRSIENGLEADKLYKKLFGKYSPKRVPVLSELALSYGTRHLLSPAVEYAKAAGQIVSMQVSARKTDYLGDLTLGGVRIMEISGRNAMSYLERACETLDSRFGTTDPQSVRARIWLGDAAMRCRAYEDAAAAYGEAADRLSQAGAAEETVTSVRNVQTAIGGIRAFLEERTERLRVELSTWDGT